MEGMQNITERGRNLDEVFFEKGNKHARDKCKNTEKH